MDKVAHDLLDRVLKVASLGAQFVRQVRHHEHGLVRETAFVLRIEDVDGSINHLMAAKPTLDLCGGPDTRRCLRDARRRASGSLIPRLQRQFKYALCGVFAPSSATGAIDELSVSWLEDFFISITWILRERSRR